MLETIELQRARRPLKCSVLEGPCIAACSETLLNRSVFETLELHRAGGIKVGLAPRPSLGGSESDEVADIGCKL